MSLKSVLILLLNTLGFYIAFVSNMVCLYIMLLILFYELTYYLQPVYNNTTLEHKTDYPQAKEVKHEKHDRYERL